MKKTLFTIDGLSRPAEGYTAGDHWNGWACPFFTKAEAERILTELFGADGWEYDPETDCYFIGETEEDFEGQPFDTGAGLAQPLYGIGAYSWTWDEVEDGSA